MTDDLQRGTDQIQGENEQSAEGTLFGGDVGRASGQAGEATVVNRPAPGQTVEIQAAPGQTYVLNFAPGEAQVLVEGDNFILAFDDNGDGTPDSQIVFLDLVNVAEAGEAPTFQVAGVDIGSEVLLGQALALAGQGEIPLDDVAAGPAATGGGASAYSDNLGSILDLLAAQGVIPPTALQFRLIELDDRITVLDPAEGDITLTFNTNVDGGEGSFSFDGGFEDWQPTQDGCDNPTFPMQVIVGFTPNDNEVLVSFTLSGIPDGATLFIGGIEVPTVGGTSPLLTPADLASGITLLPPADSGDDIPLTVTATISDPDSGETAVITGSATAIIDSVADNPSALFDGEVVDVQDGCEGAEGNGASQDDIESFLGLYGGALDVAADDGDSSNGTEDATDGAAIKTTLELQAGDQVEMTFNFLDAEGSGPGASFQDFAFITINGVVFPIANVGESNDSTSAVYLGSGLILTWSEESGYFTLSGTVEESGTFVLGIGVMNEGDNSVDSALLIDNLIVTRGDEVVFQDDFSSFDNWEILGGGFVAIVGDVHTNEGMPGAPTQGLLIASGDFDASSCGCEVIVSKVTYNEDNAAPLGGDEILEPTLVQQQDGGGDGCDLADQQPIFGAGFVAAVTDTDGSESLTKITIATSTEEAPGGFDQSGLEVALSGEDDAAATNFMVGDQVLVDGDTVEVMATFADGSTGLATGTIGIADGVLTLTFDAADRVQSVDLSGDSDTPFQVRLPQHSDDDFHLNLEVTATEFDIDGELDTNNNVATHQAVLQVEVKAVADGATLSAGTAGDNFAEDGESDPANHGLDSSEEGLLIPLTSLGAQLIDKDGSESITQIKVSLEGADDGAVFVAANGDPLGATLQVEVADGVFVTADVSIVGDSLVLTFGEDAAGYDIDLSNVVGVKLPVDDSSDFTVKVEATATEIHPEGDVACESKTTETSFDVHVAGVAGPAAVAFGDYDNFPQCGEPTIEGNVLTLTLFEDGYGAVADQAGEGGEAGPQTLPEFFTAQTQASAGSEAITQIVVSLDGAPDGTIFVDGLGDPLEAGDTVDGGVVSFEDGQLVLTFEPGVQSVDLSTMSVEIPQHSDDDFSIQIKTTTTEYDDDGTGALAGSDSYETDATINVNIDAVADPVTVAITVNDNAADAENQFGPGETGSVKVEASFGDVDDGSETHTVTVDVPEGFTVGTLDGLPDGVTALVNGDGDVVFTVGAGVSSLDYTFEVTAPSEGVSDDSLFLFTATAKAEESTTGDAECTDENNVATAVDSQEVSGEVAGEPEVGATIQQADCIEEDSSAQVEITADPTTVGDTITQVVVEVPEGWGISATVGGQITAVDDSTPGQLTLTVSGATYPSGFTGTITVTPPADSDVDGSIKVTATAVDGLDSTDGDGTFALPVDANADGIDGSNGDDGDAANLSVSIAVADSTGEVPENGSFQAGETGTVTVSATFDDYKDGSETHTVTIEAPEGFTIGAVVGDLPAGVSLVSNDGSTLVLSVDSQDGDGQDGVGSFSATFEVTNVSADSGEAVFE
ncbi:MAG: hypothetical protein ACFB13_13455, partial [Kiloniellaceae bacterium]